MKVTIKRNMAGQYTMFFHRHWMGQLHMRRVAIDARVHADERDFDPFIVWCNEFATETGIVLAPGTEKVFEFTAQQKPKEVK